MSEGFTLLMHVQLLLKIYMPHSYVLNIYDYYFCILIAYNYVHHFVSGAVLWDTISRYTVTQSNINSNNLGFLAGHNRKKGVHF